LVIEAEKLEGRAGASDPVLQMCLGVVVKRYRHAMAQLQAITAGVHQDDEAPFAWPATATCDADPAFAAAAETLREEHDLSRGLRADEFALFYQPIVDLRSRRLAGFEALMRWHHPQRGLVPPGNFIPMAEAGGLIVELTRWALAEIGRVLPLVLAAERENPAGTDTLFMTVNISAADLMQDGFPAAVCDTLANAGIAPARLKVELTESMIMTDVKHATQTLRVFAQAGIGVAIDDFGTGYSSLSSLASLPISTLKVDRSFVKSMLHDATHRRIVNTILHLAAELGVPVVAEGIEGEAEAAALTSLHCEYGQGYLFGRPMPQADMLATIRSWQPPLTAGETR
jgi:EAL domain-containing protein (putative c-di-GMP-specific phosphodiesterase class I)